MTNKIVLPILAFISALLTFSCSYSKIRHSESSNIAPEDTVSDDIVEVEEYEPFYQMVMAKHFTGNLNDNNEEIVFDCFVFKLDNSFIKFENKASYELLANMVAFPIVVIKEYGYERTRKAEFASIEENSLKKVFLKQ